MQNLFIDKTTSRYYFNELNKKCSICLKKIIDVSNIIYIRNVWSKKHHELLYYCRNCATKKAENESYVYLYKDMIHAILETELPLSCVLVLNLPPQLSPSKDTDVFSLAITNREGEQTISKTKYALKETFEGAKIGNEEIYKICEKKDKVLSTDKGLDFLSELGNAEAILPETIKKKEIEHKEGKENGK